jgi:hypothetical protein
VRPDHLLNIPCTIHAVSDGAVDEYGDPTVTTTDIEAVCWVDRRGGAGASEDVGGEKWQSNLLDLYLPAGTALGGDDRVTVLGDLFEVEGPPHEHVHPVSGDGVYVAARIRRVT